MDQTQRVTDEIKLRPPDIATAPIEELREYMQDLETLAQQVGPGDVNAYASVTHNIGIIYNAMLDRAQGLPVNDSDRRVLLGLPTQEVLARVHEEAEQIAQHPVMEQGVSAEPQQGQSLTAGVATQQENEASLPDTLRSRYASLQSEISTVDARTPGEAVAATNYFRGRVEELNYTRDLLLGEDQSVPSMDIEQIQIGCSQGREQGHELGIG